MVSLRDLFRALLAQSSEPSRGEPKTGRVP